MVQWLHQIIPEKKGTNRMKKILCALLAALLILPAASCSPATTDGLTGTTDAASAMPETEPEPEPEKKPFRVAAYVRTDLPYEFSHLDNGITDLILIGGTDFDKKGVITVNDNAATCIQKSKEAIGDRPIRLFCTLGAINQEYIQAFRSGVLETNIVAFLEEYGLDGVSFDWEFPENRTQWRLYSGFLVSLDKALGDEYLLSVALHDSHPEMTPEAIAIMDHVELMSYDIWDENHMHASLTRVKKSVQKLLDYGYRAEQISMGIPLYGRPQTGEARWPSYSAYYQLMDENGLYYDESSGLTFSFDTYEAVYEKTMWAIENGLGGVMTFTNHCDLPADNEMALQNAIAEAIRDAAAAE